ncbi:helicase 2 [Phenacoccus solenopsis nudivirus]|nr:helicase 2 [Phenacoccus solenopsis nudivirus]
MTVAHTLMSKHDQLPHIVIFKNDLINKYRYCASGFSFAQFCIYAFDLSNLESYKSIERIVNRNTSAECYMTMILQLIRNFRVKSTPRNNVSVMDLRGNMIFFDEYTVISKPLLYVILTACKINNLRHCFCGDCGQLGCITTSTHSNNTSSYDIIRAFADKTFTLDDYVRCNDVEYNRKIALVGSISGNEKLGLQGNALAAAIFFPNLINSIHSDDTFIMNNHRPISHTMHVELMKSLNTQIVYNENRRVVEGAAFKYTIHYAYSFWRLEKTRAEVEGVQGNNNVFVPKPVYRYELGVKMHEIIKSPTSTPEEKTYAERFMREHVPGKYLPYLILKVGSIYYYKVFSESSLCILREIYCTNNDPSKPRQLAIEMLDENAQPNGSRIIIQNFSKCNNVVFSQHLNYLTNNGDDTRSGSGTLINFALYPKFYMSVYMSQGCTITSKVSFNTEDFNYQSLYVMMSRVNTPKNINSVLVENPIAQLVSIIMNFDVVSCDNVIDVDEIEDKILCNTYTLYNVAYVSNENGNTSHLMQLIRIIMNTNIDKPTRREYMENLRELIYARVHSGDITVTRIPPRENYIKQNTQTKHVTQNTMNFMLKYRSIFAALSRLGQIESSIWLRAFLQHPKIYGQLNGTVFSHADEYPTQNPLFNFSSVFESADNYKTLDGIDTASLFAKCTPEVVHFIEAVRRINENLWTGGKSSEKRRKTTQYANINDHDDFEQLSLLTQKSQYTPFSPFEKPATAVRSSKKVSVAMPETLPNNRSHGKSIELDNKHSTTTTASKIEEFAKKASEAETLTELLMLRLQL